MLYKHWDDSYLLGYRSLDAEHKFLFEILKRIDTALESEAAPGTAQSLVEQLVDYREDDLHAIFHDAQPCSPEQAAWLQEHRAEHNYLADRARAFMAYKSGREQDRLQDLRSFLSRWLTDHIQANQKALQKLRPQESKA